MAQGMDLSGINKSACFKVLTFCVNDTLSSYNNLKMHI